MKKILKAVSALLLCLTILTGCSGEDVELFADILRQLAETSEVDTSNGLTVKYIDVGQGDSTVIYLPNGKTILIDAGTADAYDKIDECLQNTNTDKIDFLIATHPHADHIGSMRKIVENYEIGSIYMPNAVTDTATFEKLLLAIKNNGYTVNTTVGGMTVLDEDGVKVETLAPNSDKYDSLNDYSIVVKVTFGNCKFLFTGDAEKLSEKEILSKGYDLSADVLKAGHHGSSTATSKEFLSAVNPDYAVISCGKDNEYGHPHKEVKELFKKFDIRYFRTDTDGTVTALCDGDNISIITENGGGENQ